MVVNTAPSTSSVNPAQPRDAFNCNFVDHSCQQTPFRILSQVVRISDIEFKNRSFRVSTELSVIAVRADARHIILDLGRDCVLPDEQAFQGRGRITVNGHDAKYVRHKFVVSSEDSTDKSLFHLKRLYKQALTNYQGDLIIEVPSQCEHDIEEQTVLQVGIDIIVLAPREGINFVWNGKSSDEDIGSHMYTYRSNLLSSTKEWLPSLASTSQLAVWKFEITVDKKFTAVCCGDLTDTISCAEDESQKTFHYQLLIPTSAGNIGFAVGDFKIHVLPDIPEIISFTLPGLMPLLKYTVSSLDRTYTFFEELLSCRYPYGFYRQVFVDQIPDELTSYAGLSLCSVNVLYHKKILDVVQPTRELLALAIAQQFFGCFVSPSDFTELWLVKSLARFITALFVERSFGLSEYITKMNNVLNSFCDYESKYGKIVISQSSAPHHLGRPGSEAFSYLHFDPLRPETCSPLYANALFCKGHFVMRMLQKRLGIDQFTKVLHRILSVAVQYSQNLKRPVDWFHMLISTDTFFRTVTNVTSRELPTFVEQWINTGGHVHFHVLSTFNRKHNKLELEIRQELSANSGLQNYVGPLTVTLQEFDGCFSHTIQVDATISKHDLQCHSKGRKLKKKRVPIATGEEVEMDLAQMEADSPVLWIRIDPDMLIPRRVRLNQNVHQWECMLRHERDVLGQIDAIDTLRNFPVHQTKSALMDVVENPRFYYKVRGKAAHCLVDVCNRLPEALMAGVQSPLVEYFQRLFCSKSAPSLPVSNNYVATSSNLQQYFLMLDLISAIASTRSNGGKTCPGEVIDFLIRLIKYNDNSVNRYSDDFYRAALIRALNMATIMNEHATKYPMPEMLSPEASRILVEVTHALNMDTMKPSFGRVIGIECLRTIIRQQKLKHVPVDSSILWKFAEGRGVYAPMRKAALECIISLLHKNRQANLVENALRLVDVALADPDPFIRYSAVEELCKLPPFTVSDEEYAQYPLNCKDLANVLWNAIRRPDTENRIRTMLIDLYLSLYGAKETPLAIKRNS
ncbi:peptidase family m1 domain-containing protein [Ditylenchus destructor]|nr:peptidase family m1 domain-containing protein [Ditylenchus destructor]